MSRAVIIGSGIGGLSLGCLLLRRGIKVTILEKEPVPGGCLRSFIRNGVFFDTGMHMIGSAEPGQVTDTLLRYMGVREQLELKRLDPNGYDIINIDGKEFRFANGREGFIETLGEDFPLEKDNLASFFDLIQSVASIAEIKHNTLDVGTSYKFSDNNLVDKNEVIGRCFKDPLLRKVISGNRILYDGGKEKVPFQVMAFIMDNYNKSAFRIKGGSEQLAKSLANRIVSLGGEIICRKEVVKIDTENGKARGVETSDGCYFAGEWIISTVHPKLTFGMLKDSPFIRKVQKDRIFSMENTTSAFSLYMKFREKSVPYLNSNFYGNSDSGNYFIYTHNADKCSEQIWATGGSIITAMNFDDVSKWANTVTNNRGKEYEEFKTKRAEALLEQLYSFHPHLRGCVEKYWTSTPLTFRDYTGTDEGSIYGIRPNAESVIPYRTKIPNLFLGGQSILTYHGLQGVMTGSLLIASSIVNGEDLFKEMSQYL